MISRLLPQSSSHGISGKLVPVEDPLDSGRMLHSLAIARLCLCLAAIALSLFDPERPQGSLGTLGTFFAVYALYSILVIGTLNRKLRTGHSFRLILQLIDMAAVAALSILTGGFNSAFAILVLFVLVAAACRWGFRETVLSAFAIVVLAPAGNVCHEYFLHGRVAHWNAMFLVDSEVSLAYVLAAGCVIGYISQRMKTLQAEKIALARVIGGINPEAGFTATLSRFCAEVLQMFGAKKVLFATRATSTGALHLWEAEPYRPNESLLQSDQPGPEKIDSYFFGLPGLVLYQHRTKSGTAEGASAVCVDSSDLSVRKKEFDLPPEFLALHPCESAAICSLQPYAEWSVRLFLLEPSRAMCGKDGLLFLSTLCSRVMPMIHEVSLARHKRGKALERERASVARELHDGVIQSLLAIEFKLQRILPQNGTRDAEAIERLAEVREHLLREIRGVRMLTQRLKQPQLSARECVPMLRVLAAQFEDESSIAVRFRAGVEEVDLPSRVCGEVMRITQEALANVRKHSMANEVDICLQENHHGYALEVRDNGKGFEFSGRLSLEQLDADSKGPEIIKERVRLIAGSLIVESTPGQGSRLEVIIPRGQNGGT